MEPPSTAIIYQNLLFAEGLECILQLNNYKVIKKEISELKELRPSQLSNAKLAIVEASWPFQKLGEIIEELITLLKDHSKIILIINIINKNIFRIVSKRKINGIVLKCSSKDEFLFGIKEVLEGRTYYSSVIANLFLKDKNETEA